MRPDYEALFAFLGDHGVPRERVVLAWEAVTFSDEFALSELRPWSTRRCPSWPRRRRLRGRPLLHRRREENERFGCEAQEGADRPLSPRTWRRIYGRVELPSILGDDG